MRRSVETIDYAGELVHFTDMDMLLDNKHCVLCNKPIKFRAQIYLVSTSVSIGREPLFPNVFIHKSCAKGLLYHAAKTLHAYWRKARKYRYWFTE